MSILVLPPTEQAIENIDEGRIREKKPVSLPFEERGIKGFSNLYYWCYAWSDDGGEYEVHSHKGFEILIYVIEGEIENFDPEKGSWLKMGAGEIQLIKSGSGLEHGVKFHPGARVIEIWFDPDLRTSLQKPPRYIYFEPDEFEVIERAGVQIVDYLGDESPMILSAKSLIERHDIRAGSHYTLDVPARHHLSGFVLSGSLELDDQTVKAADFFKVEDQDTVNVKATEDASVFIMHSPFELEYKSYIDQLQTSA